MEKIAEILFDNSEEIPNDKYITFMDMLKRHYDHKDNEDEIRNYLKNFDKKIRKQLEIHLPSQSFSFVSKLFWCSLTTGISIIAGGVVCYYFFNANSH
jgi:hypothetical protein